MKRFFATLILLLAFASAGSAAMTYTMTSPPNADWWSGAISTGKDTATLWAREVETIIEGFTLDQGFFTGTNGGIMSNEVNNRFEWTENSETFGWIFSSNTITWATDSGVTVVDTNGINILLNDSGDLIFGTDSDFTLDSDTAKTLDFIPGAATDDYAVNLGLDQSGVDLKLFGATTGEYWLFDASEDSVLPVLGNYLFTATDAEVNQFKVDATGTVAGFSTVIETTDSGIQLNADGAANGDISIDAADDLDLIAGGEVELQTGGSVTLVGGPLIPAQTAFSADANNITNYGAVAIDSSGGAMDPNLADASGGVAAIGQTVLLSMQTAGNNCDVYVTSHVTSDPEVFRFSAVDEWLLLVWTGTEWATVAGDAATP